MKNNAVKTNFELPRLCEEYSKWLEAKRIAEVWRLNDERNKREASNDSTRNI